MSSFECEICLYSNNTTYYFNCDHLFCDKCLFQTLFKEVKNGKTLNLAELFSCPLCGVKSIFPLEKFINEYKYLSSPPPEKKSCEACEDNEINRYCYNCKIYICQRCLDEKHNKLKKFKTHLVSDEITLRGNLNYCNCLKDRVIKISCSQCEVFICEICCLLFHMSHEIKSIAQDSNKTKGFYIKEELIEKVNKYLNIDLIMSTIDSLLYENKLLLSEGSINSTMIDTVLKLNSNITEGTKRMIEQFGSISQTSISKIKPFIDVHQRTITRIKLMNKMIFKLLGNKQFTYCYRKNIELGKFAKLTNKLTKAIKSISLLFSSSVGIMKKNNEPDDKRMTLIDGKLIFKADLVKIFKYKANVLVTNAIFKDVSPYMITAFRGNSGQCFAGFINNQDFSIEISNITTIENFKEYDDREDNDFRIVEASLSDKSISKTPADRNCLSQAVSKNSSLVHLTKPVIKTSRTNQGSEVKAAKDKENSQSKPSAIKIQGGLSKGVSNKLPLTKRTYNSVKSQSSKIVLKGNHLSAFVTNNIDKKRYLIKAHNNTINGLRQYKIDKEDFLLSFSDDRTVKLWSCDYLHEVISITHEHPVKSAAILQHEGIRYFLVGSFVRDYPIGIFTFNGSFLYQLKIKGYTYHIDSYTSEDNAYIFVSTYSPYQLLIYDFETRDKLYTISTKSYVNNISVSSFETLIMTYIERTGEITQYDLIKGCVIRKVSNYGNHSIMKWNEKYYLFSGKGNGFLVVDIQDLSIISEYKNIHMNQIKGICKFQHHIYGEMIVSIGQDQRINVMK